MNKKIFIYLPSAFTLLLIIAAFLYNIHMLNIFKQAEFENSVEKTEKSLTELFSSRIILTLQ